MKNTSKVVFKLVWMVIVAMFLNIAAIYGQTNNYTTKIKDGSVANSAPTAIANSLLELESSNKGFLLPRMSTADRNKISITDKERGNGLAIYNTDTDCVNYWSKTGNRWLSLCGTLSPAIIELQDCSKITLNASGDKMLQQGKYLRDSDILYVSLNVLEPGTFDISAMTDNGYYFSRAGSFDTSGLYTIALEGLGTPMNGNETVGDLVTFTINGKQATNCNNFRIKVRQSNIDYTLVEPQDITVDWNAYIGMALNANDHKVKLKVNVKSVGVWRIQSTQTINGMSFSGSGEFIQEGEQTIEVLGQGVPVAATAIGAPNVFSFTTNSATNNNPTNVKVRVNVKPVDYSLVCDDQQNKIEIRGEFKEDSKLTGNNSILIPVKVLAPGQTTIELRGNFITANGQSPVTFKAENVNLTFNANRNNIQYVTLYANDVMIPKGTTQIKFSSITPNNSAVCSSFPTISVESQPIRYSILCNTIRVNGNYTVGGKFSQDNYIELDVDVDYPGEYNIQTDEINGVSFSGQGSFTGKGTQKIRLTPKGEYNDADNLVYTVTTNSQAGTTTCSTTVRVQYREIVILTLGNYNYGPNTGNVYAGGAIANSRVNFGPNGKVKVQNIRILTSNVQGEALRTFIRNNKVDIIFSVIAYPISAQTSNVLEDFIKTDKGVFILSDESYVRNYSKAFIERLTGSSGLVADGRFTMTNPVLSGLGNNPIINNVFGDLNGKYLGNDAANGWYYQNLPSNVIPLVSKSGNSNDVWSFMHKDLGFVFVGDGGWIVGTSNNTSLSIWPSRFTSNGTPIGKPYYQGVEVYNSVYYANILAWAIDYVKTNKAAN
ncbi:hypothetical protein ACYSNM_09395 [Myroides sp. LJL116]